MELHTNQETVFSFWIKLDSAYYLNGLSTITYCSLYPSHSSCPRKRQILFYLWKMLCNFYQYQVANNHLHQPCTFPVSPLVFCSVILILHQKELFIVSTPYLFADLIKQQENKILIFWMKMVGCHIYLLFSYSRPSLKWQKGKIL